MLFLAFHLLLAARCQVELPDYSKAHLFFIAAVKVPTFFIPQPCSTDDSPFLTVFARKSTSAKRIEIRWSANGPGTCAPMVFEPAQTCPRGIVPMMEDGYEERAFVEVERDGTWARIRLDQGTGWIRLSKADEVVDYFDLVADRQAVMTSAWDGRIRSRPGGRLLTLPRVEKQYVRVIDSRRVGGRLWFQVQALSDSPCESQEPRVLVTGWVRAYSDKRQPTVYHFSRGC